MTHDVEAEAINFVVNSPSAQAIADELAHHGSFCGGV